MRTAILTSGRDALELKGGLRDVDAGSDEEERELSVESCGIDTPAEVHGLCFVKRRDFLGSCGGWAAVALRLQARSSCMDGTHYRYVTFLPRLSPQRDINWG